MKKITLTQGKFALVDDEDYDWLMTWKWCACKDRSTFYARTSIREYGFQHSMQMHRLLMMFPFDLLIDHADHNGLNNQKYNLSIVTTRKNLQNRSKPGTSQYPGVCWSKSNKKWQADIFISGKKTYLGQYHDEVEASEVYNNCLKKHS